MKAFVRINAASQEVRLMDMPVPNMQPDEVLIKVEAFGVGVHDRYFIPQNAEFPYIIGSEGAGTIAGLGDKVTEFARGDRVIFTTVLQPQGGSWAEYAVAKQNVLIPLPHSLDFAQGAAVPIAGKTALECVRELDLRKDDTLFIAGASGAIGTLVIQIVSRKGVRISASASEKNHEYLKSLGVEKAVDYNDAEWKNKIKEWCKNGVTAALAIQPLTGADSIEVVQNGGKVITVSGDNNSFKPERNIIVQQMGHHIEKEELAKLVNDIADGKIKIVIEKEFTFNNALEALKKTETRHARGKVIVKVSIN